MNRITKNEYQKRCFNLLNRFVKILWNLCGVIKTVGNGQARVTLVFCYSSICSHDVMPRQQPNDNHT